MNASIGVRHAREVGGRGSAIDLCYLEWMGESALLPLIELESRPLSPDLRERVVTVRASLVERLERKQASSGWDWRGARRLSAARTLIAQRRLPGKAPRQRLCSGRLPVASVAKPAFAPRQSLTADGAR